MSESEWDRITIADQIIVIMSTIGHGWLAVLTGGDVHLTITGRAAPCSMVCCILSLDGARGNAYTHDGNYMLA